MESEADKAQNKRKIIIVEDNENVAKLIAKSLNEEGYITKVVSFGSAAVFYAMDNLNSLLLMEYQLPDMTAKEVIATLRNNQQDIPFIIISPPGNEKAIIDMMKLGARDYLMKEHGFLELLPASIKKVTQQLDVEERLEEAEKSLRSSEDKFKYIFHSITDAIFIYDFQGKILEANQAASLLLGYDKSKINTMNYIDFHLTEFNNNFKLYLAELKTYKNLKYESVFVDSFGHRIPVECISRLIEYENEPAILTFSHDISERKQSENMLKQSEERLQRITNTMTDYIFTVYVENGRPQRTVHSSACLPVTGYTPEEFTKNSFLWIEMVDPRDKEFVLQNVKKILSGEQINPFEHRIIRKDGKQAWLRNTPVLHYDNSGKLISYDGVVQDITERKIAEVELLEKQAQLSAIVEAFEGLIYVCSDEYKVEYMNEKFIARTGYNPVGELCYKALHNLEERCPWCVNDRVQQGETVKWEVQSPKDKHWYSIVNTPIYHFDGRISKQSLIIDISDLKFADLEINRLNKLYFNLLEEIDYPVCRFLFDGKIVSANQAFINIFGCNVETLATDQSLFSCIPEQLSVWTEKNLQRLDNNRSMIKKSIKQLKVNEINLVNKIWVINAIVDTENNVLEYQAILKDGKAGVDESDFVLSTS
ncbi:MAG: PAS domain S-box protein [Candidatus Cloacimonetes bacterium]|nr:PAS domain S-box protein [Candidatus Cloacimonadota bacterium]